MIKILLIITWFTLLNQKGFEIKKIIVNPKINKEINTPLSQLVKSAFYIKLEANPECLLPDIAKVLIDGSNLFVLNSHNDPDNLFLFNLEGKFIRSIGKSGRGPGEYLSILDIAINKIEKQVLILDSLGNLHIYSYDGKYIKTIKLTSRPSKIYFFNNYLYLYQAWPYYSNNNGYSLTILDWENQSIKTNLLSKKWAKVNESPQALTYPNFFIGELEGNKLTFWDQKFDTIYHISNPQTIVPKYIIELSEKLPRNLYRTEEYLEEMKNGYDISELFDLENYIFFKIIGKKLEEYYYYYNKNNNVLNKHDVTKDKSRILNDYDGSGPFRPIGLAKYNTIWTFKEPLKIKETLELNKNLKITSKNDYQKLLSLVSNADNMDNPIIILYEFK
jgi:hypothetical protein